MYDTCAAGTVSCSSWDIVTWDLQNGKFSDLYMTSSFGQTFNWAFGGVLEVYNIAQCSDYPNNPNGFSGGAHGIFFNMIGLYNYNYTLIDNRRGTKPYGPPDRLHNAAITEQCRRRYFSIISPPLHTTR